jgi:site-specific DNA recombinase
MCKRLLPEAVTLQTMSQKLRAIVGARTSITNDAKVSHTAQLEAATKWAESNNCQIIGSFEDLGVSASIPPAERPELGAYLTPEGLDGWDVICLSRLDRAFRSIRHAVDFARDMEAAGKMLVFAEDGLKLDYRPGAAKGMDAMLAELFVVLGSFFAQVELARFSERTTDSHRVLRQTDRWASGKAPFGFAITDHPSGKGKALTPNPDEQAALHKAAAMLLDGESFIRITAWMNEHHPKDRPWTVTGIAGILTSPATQGLKLHKGEPVLNSAGEPIVVAEPTFDPDTWERIQDAAALRRLNRRQPSTTLNPLLGIGYCRCGASLTLQKSRKANQSGKVNEYSYFRCGRTPKPCAKTSTKADQLLALMERRFLEKYGDQPVTRRVFQPGSDSSHELTKVLASIDRLRRESDAGLIVTDEDETLYLQRMKALVARRTKLQATPTVKAGWVVETTDKTYAEQWEEDPAPQARRELLLGSGIKLGLIPGKAFPRNAFLYEELPDGSIEARVLSEG